MTSQPASDQPAFHRPPSNGGASSSRSASPALLVLAGPTGAGKSEVALLLAERLGGEIVSVDSMQVYRGLDLGTAKPSLADRARIPHHLVDVVEVTEPFDAAQFARQARAAVADIQARGRTPVLCGGTGLYFRAFLNGLGAAPPADAALRRELEAMPLPALLHELAERDPVTYERIDRHNPRRVTRAVEVIRLTGRPFSQLRADWGQDLRPSDTAPICYGLERSPNDLRQRIDARVEAMFRGGLVDETRQLLACGLAQNRTAMQALGYRQVVEHLDGRRTLAQTVELVKLRTRQFAKRQLTWFRRQMHLQWVRPEPQEPTEAVAERLASAWASRGSISNS